MPYDSRIHFQQTNFSYYSKKGILDILNIQRYAENEALYYNKPEEVDNIEDMDTVLEDLDNNDPSPDKADHVFEYSSNSREDDKDDSVNQGMIVKSYT